MTSPSEPVHCHLLSDQPSRSGCQPTPKRTPSCRWHIPFCRCCRRGSSLGGDLTKRRKASRVYCTKVSPIPRLCPPRTANPDEQQTGFAALRINKLLCVMTEAVRHLRSDRLRNSRDDHQALIGFDSAMASEACKAGQGIPRCHIHPKSHRPFRCRSAGQR